MDIKALVPLLAQGALFLVMASFGLKTRAGEVLAALRDTSLILRGVLAVNVVVPAVAVVACLLLPIDHSVRIGIVIMAISPLAPVLPAKMSCGEFDTSRAVGLYVALILVAVVLVPLTVALLSAIFPANASLEVTALAKLVGLTVLLPILVGLAIGTWAPGLARPVGRVTAILGFGGIVVLASCSLRSGKGHHRIDRRWLSTRDRFGRDGGHHCGPPAWTTGSGTQQCLGDGSRRPSPRNCSTRRARELHRSAGHARGRALPVYQRLCNVDL